MRLSELGESGLIRRLAGNIKPGKDVIKGIGDDCAVIRITKDKYLLVTSDMLIEGVHFDLKNAKAAEIGWKALACGISDIASMGGIAKYAVVSLGLPSGCKVEFVDGIYKGMRLLAKRFGVEIIGGDTNSSKELIIDVAVLGFVEPNKVTLRSGAKPGDAICVTGALGGSYKSKKHLNFIPRLKEARALTGDFKINAMIDISDGLSTDLNHIADESKVGACIYEELVPVSKDADSLDAALNEGEDFELLFTLSAGEARALIRKNLFGAGLPVSRIGEVAVKGKGVKIIDKAGNQRELKPKGFKHF
ncbi:MAG: thiamine-phosphate kinase [Candidatus Omnitrophota bacterium]